MPLLINIAIMTILSLPKPGDPAPDFTLRDLKGRIVRLSDYAYPGPEKPNKPKKKVLLDFFRTDCRGCKLQLPKLVEYHKKHKQDTKIIVVALLEPEEGENKLRAFFKKKSVPFTVAIDTYGIVAKQYIIEDGIAELPTNYLISQDGKIEFFMSGADIDLQKLD